MKIIEDFREIQKAQTTFSASLDKYRGELIPVTIGYQSGNVSVTVKWIPTLDIWAFFGEPPEGKSSGQRYWNTFGIGKPRGMINIVCEVNSPLEGIRRLTAGAFVKDGEGEIWAAHRGRFTISGGMTKAFFRNHYLKPYVSVEDGNRISPLILIGNIQSDKFGTDLRDFVFEVDRIKEIGRADKHL